MEHIEEQHADQLGIDKHDESAARNVQAPKKPGMDVLIGGKIEHNHSHQSEAVSAQAPEKIIEVEAIENPLEPETQGTADDSDDAEFLNRAIEELCMSKAEEFALLGYDGITGKEIWEFLSENYAKTGIPPLYRLVDDILSLKVTTFMNWVTLNAYKGFSLDE